MLPTIRKVAGETNGEEAHHSGHCQTRRVSPTTVSRVLNNFDYVSEEKRQLVLQAMEDVDYRPSFTARLMRTQRSQIIGLLTDEVTTTPYAVDIVRGAQDAAWQHDKILMLLNTGQDISSARAAVHIMLEREVEGIIYAAMWHHSVEVPPNIREVPIVLANCFAEDDSLPAFVPDEVMGGYAATRNLIEHGHEHIAIINIEPDIPAAIGRLQGYKQALEEANLPIEAQYIVGDRGGSAAGFQYARQLLALEHPPTGYFAGTDQVAVGVYDALKEAGLQIGKDVGVVSYDNMELITTSLRPSLSSVQLPHYEMGYQALEYLIGVEQGDSIKHRPGKHLVPCPLVERKSV